MKYEEFMDKLDWLTSEGLSAFKTLATVDAAEIAQSALKDISALLEEFSGQEPKD